MISKKGKTILKKILPSFLTRFVSGLFYGWHGNYSSWDEAKKWCTGYDSKIILEKVKSSLLKVKAGKAAYERDSVLFDEVQYSYPVLSGLMWIAAQNKGKLNVMDFGGSLGSTYFQNKFFLESLSEVNWCIVEQSQFVDSGIESFADKKLHFFYTIEDCLKSFEINVVVLSSVLQYMEKPYGLLDQIMLHGIQFLIIDRTPFINADDRITVQKVNPGIYKGSYPCWFFNEEKFISAFSGEYNLVLKFDALDKANIPSRFMGFIFQKVNHVNQK
jgi:putative methyltransferase (TIGR04325 family)